jgi:phage terminase large subunit-like protein
MTSLAARLVSLPEAQRAELLKNMTPEAAEELLFRWDFWARPDQLPPKGDWRIWLVLSGRGWGKTRTGSEWVRSMACGKTPLAPGKCKRIAIVGETAADCRDVLAQGDSGVLSVHPKDFRPIYSPSTRSLTWPNGAKAFLYNGTEPDQLRGPNHDAALVDELAKYRYSKELWDQLQFGLRLGDRPQQLITTTPRPIPIIRELISASHEPDSGVIVTRGSTFDNHHNLSASFLDAVEQRYAGTRLGRQELDGEIIDDVPGALWSRQVIDEHRRKLSDELPAMRRIIVSIDPAAKASKDTDTTSETGIAVVGEGVDGRGYLIDDRSCRLGPAGWAAVAVSAFDYYEGDAIVAEVNQGGDMVEQVIKAVRPSIKVIQVRATRGKVLRAEPVSALYAQGVISHDGSFPLLEDQMMQFTSFGIEGDGDADRVDAVVHGFTELFPRLIGKVEPKKRQQSGYVGRPGRSSVTGY